MPTKPNPTPFDEFHSALAIAAAVVHVAPAPDDLDAIDAACNALDQEWHIGEQSDLIKPFMNDIAMLAQKAIAGLVMGDPALFVGGFQSVFLYGYLRGVTERQTAEQGG